MKPSSDAHDVQRSLDEEGTTKVEAAAAVLFDTPLPDAGPARVQELERRAHQVERILASEDERSKW